MTITTSSTRQKHRGSLAIVGLNNKLAFDHGISSEDDLKDDQRIYLDQAGGFIGVSIGREQTRLTSLNTPANEKAAAIEQAGGFFDGDVQDEGILEEAEDQEQDKAGSHETVTGLQTSRIDKASQPFSNRPISPWRAVAKDSPRSSVSRNALRDSLSFGRKRSSSGPDSIRESWQRSLKSSFPSIFTKDSSLERPESFNGEKDHSRRDLPSSKDIAPEEGDSPIPPQLAPIRTRPSQLQRSVSDSSLQPHRTLSRVSSLGDDKRFADVHQQVNSRLKAIKDSWHDSSLKLPHLGSLSNLSNLAPDFLRERSLSFGRYSSKLSDANTVSSEKPVDPFTRQPYTSAKAAVKDAATEKTHSHPHFHKALQDLKGDVVVLGGYRGSILRSAEPPHRQVWVPVKVGLNLRKVNLEVGLGEGDDEKAKGTIFADGMLTHIGPVDISKRLLKRLRQSVNVQDGVLRVHDYGYDWRLHPIFLSDQLIRFLESLPCNQPDVARNERGATVLAHSLGGLITRHAVNRRPELFKGVVYAGVPQTCVNILGPLRNGDEVLLSSRVLTAQVNFTIRTSFALLPLDGRCFIDRDTKEEYRVDFFDPQTWIDYRLSPCVARPLPSLVPPPKPTGISGYVSSMANALSVAGRRNSAGRPSSPSHPSKKSTTASVAEPDMLDNKSHDTTDPVVRDNTDSSPTGRAPGPDETSSPRTTVTIPRAAAIEYLTRTLTTIKKFKEDLAFDSAHAAANIYPPVAVIYGKSTPTVYGARVHGREGIKHADAYDDLAFASGDGVVLARAAMLPKGYRAARGGIVSSERGHVTLLGDLEAVGRCLIAVQEGRARGTGLGLDRSITH